MKKIASIIIFSLLLSSCIFVEVKLSDADLKNIRKVGLVSLLPNDANLHYVGVTIFNNTYNKIEINGVNANNVAYEAASNALSGKGIEVVKLNAKKDLTKLLYKNSYSSPDKDEIQKELVKLANSAKVNHIIIIYSNPVQDRIAKSAEFNSGYGIFKRVGTAPAIYSSVSVDVAQTSPFNSLISSKDITIKSLPDSFWHKEYEDGNENYVGIPDNEEIIISDSIKKAVTDSVLNALKYSGLTR